MNPVHYSSKTTEWETPDALFAQLDAEFHFTIDPCATKKNAKCERFYTKKDDGMSQSWAGEIVFLNPPYGNAVKWWVKKCHDEAQKYGKVIVALLAARTDTKWFHSYIYGKAEIRFLKGRVTFKGAPHPAPFPSMIVVWR